MSLLKYYRVLGLPEGSDQAAIRKQFRRLAMKYHPDKNPSASAQVKFIAITEAYEILTGKKPAPQTRISRSRTSASPFTETQKAYERKVKSNAERVREAKERQEEQLKREQEENERYFQQLTTGWRWRVMRLSAICGIILSIGLIAERFLPNHYKPDQVTHYKINAGFSNGRELLSIVNTTQNTFWISQLDDDLYGKDTRVFIQSSWIFHEPIALISRGKLWNTPYYAHFTFYSTFWLMIVFFLLPSITYFTKDRTILFTVMHQTSLYGVNLLMLYFLFRNDHWAHLITLGFL